MSDTDMLIQARLLCDLETAQFCWNFHPGPYVIVQCTCGWTTNPKAAPLPHPHFPGGHTEQKSYFTRSWNEDLVSLKCWSWSDVNGLYVRPMTLREYNLILALAKTTVDGIYI